MSGLPSFFHHSAKRTHIADTIVGRRIPTSVITRWTSNSKIVGVINDDWDSLKQVFIAIINDPTSDQISIRQSDGFLNKFNDFEFALMVVLFSDIFGLTDILFDVLQKKSLDINYCISQIRSTHNISKIKRNEDNFKKIFDLAVLKTSLPTEGREGRSRVNYTSDQVFQKYKVLYYEILDNFSTQITTRFQDMEKLYFITLVDNHKFISHSKSFPTEALNSLKVYYPSLFNDLPRLKNELQLIYSDEQYRDKGQQDLMEILTENKNIFKETYKLFCLILTIPSTSVSVERSFSCLKRVKTYLRNTMTEERLSNLSTISIEKELLTELINTQPFYEDIINNFASLKDRRIALIYKNHQN